MNKSIFKKWLFLDDDEDFEVEFNSETMTFTTSLKKPLIKQ